MYTFFLEYTDIKYTRVHTGTLIYSTPDYTRHTGTLIYSAPEYPGHTGTLIYSSPEYIHIHRVHQTPS